MDRYAPAEAAIGLVAMVLAPLSVGALRLFRPFELAGSPAPWLPAIFGGAAAVLCALAMVVGTARGLRGASPARLLRAGALGTLAAGLAATAVRGVSPPEDFPDPALALTAVVAGVLLLAASVVPERMARDRGWFAATLVSLFVVVEGTLAAALFLTPAAAAGPWLLVAAAAMAAISTIRGPRLAAALVAAGLVALAASRAGALDTVPGLVALGAGGMAYALSDLGLRLRGHADHAQQAPDGSAPSPTAPPPVDAPPVDATPTAGDDEATRLARELRGTIAELLQVRRTVELQRDEILRLDTQDQLTGIATRRTLLDRLQVEASEARRYSHPVALVLLDLDGFTALNREHGMGVGDEVLREVALRLRLRMREADGLGRIGSDSFLVLLPHTDETGAATFADALLQRLVSRPIDTYDGELTIAVSVGIAIMRPRMSLTDDELLAEADAALASARAAGGNRIAFDRMHGLVRLDERRLPGAPVEEPPREADSTT